MKLFLLICVIFCLSCSKPRSRNLDGIVNGTRSSTNTENTLEYNINLELFKTGDLFNQVNTFNLPDKVESSKIVNLKYFFNSNQFSSLKLMSDSLIHNCSDADLQKKIVLIKEGLVVSTNVSEKVKIEENQDYILQVSMRARSCTSLSYGPQIWLGFETNNPNIVYQCQDENGLQFFHLKNKSQVYVNDGGIKGYLAGKNICGIETDIISDESTVINFPFESVSGVITDVKDNKINYQVRYSADKLKSEVICTFSDEVISIRLNSCEQKIMDYSLFE